MFRGGPKDLLFYVNYDDYLIIFNCNFNLTHMQPFDYIIRKFLDIKAFFRYNFNKRHLNVVKTAYKGYPFDFYFIWKLERAKLQEMLHYFENAKIIDNYKPIIRDIRLALKLLNIVMEEELVFSYKNGNLFKYECLVDVNLRNCKRYFNKEDSEFIYRMPHILYLAKAKKLYYKLLEYRIETWWD